MPDNAGNSPHTTSKEAFWRADFPDLSEPSSPNLGLIINCVNTTGLRCNPVTVLMRYCIGPKTGTKRFRSGALAGILTYSLEPVFYGSK